MLVLAGLAFSGMVAADANAAVKSFWDQETKKWVKYDTSVKRVVPRNYSPIKRRVIDYDGPFKPNTIIINTSERRLYYVMKDGKALKYGVGVGRQGFQWSGTDRVSRKAEWPGWTPPPEMIARERKKGRILPKYMKGGPRNPLGARALYIGDTLYRIHGSNEPWSIGRAVSSGCIRLTNDDVKHLYNQVRVGTRVVVLTGKESKAKIMALANPPAPKKPATVAMEDEAKDGDNAQVAARSSAKAKDDEVVILAPADEGEEAVSEETTGTVKSAPRVKDDDVMVRAPATAEPEATEARVKDDDVVTPDSAEADVTAAVVEQAVAAN
ncbi:L,D-transpeptidase family protein [Bauldia sp.]|uniref:L,D-transpeptidase family protein n=1 Tax=Bauldia sp. TaxID=2575872 RepID=UPI003BAB3650